MISFTKLNGIWLAVGLFLLWPVGSVFAGTQLTCQKYGVVAEFSDVFSLKHVKKKGAKACTAVIKSKVRMTFYVFAAGKNKTLNLKGLTSRLRKITGASRFPVPFFDRRHLLSSIDYIYNGNVLPDLFVNESGKKGFLWYVLSEKRAVVVTFASARSGTHQELFDLVKLTDTAKNWPLKAVLALVVVAPVLVLLGISIPSRYRNTFWRLVDSARNYGMSAGVFFLLIPAAALLAFGGFGFQTAGFSAALAAAILLGTVVLRSVFRALRKRRLSQDAKPVADILASWVKAESGTTVYGAPVTKKLSRILTVWQRYNLACKRCHLAYSVYTPSRAEQIVGDGVGATDRELTQKEMDTLFEKARADSKPPINGCPRCGDRAHISTEPTASYKTRTKEDLAYAAVFLVVGLGGALTWNYLGSSESVNSTRTFAWAKYVGSWIPLDLNEIAIGSGIVILASVYALYNLLTKKTGRFGVWGCANDGVLFENIEPRSHLEQTCPSCRKPMLPIRDIRLGR